MGLRIIDRIKKPSSLPDEKVEWETCLKDSTSEWLRLRGESQIQDRLTSFLQTIESSKSTLKNHDQAYDLAKRFSSHLRGGWSSGFEPHQKVDVATLLVLL